jgi:hypothetical protein
MWYFRRLKDWRGSWYLRDGSASARTRGAATAWLLEWTAVSIILHHGGWGA